MSAQPTDGHGISMRELEVIRLVGDGLTDQQIAARLFLSRRTVNAHLCKIYAKTGIRSRVALAMAWSRVAQPEELAEMQETGTVLPGRNAPASTVRITVDLPPEMYRLLTSWILSAAPQVGRPKLSLSDTVRAMIMTTCAGDAEASNALMVQLRDQRP